MNIRSLFFILVLISISSAAACVQNTFQQLIFSDMGVFIGIAFMFSILVIVITFLAGKVTNEPRFLIFYKDELFHLFFSAVLLIGIGGIVFFSCNVMAGFMDFVLEDRGTATTLLNVSRTTGSKLSQCYTGIESPQSVAACYFRKMETETDQLVKQTIKDSIKNEMDSTLVITTYTPITGGVSLPWTAYQRTFSMQYDMVTTNFATPALVSITMQRILVTFAVDFTMFILPTALFLRILLPTRAMGNALIALAIALYIIIPVFYALMAVMDDVVFTDCNSYSGLISDIVFDVKDSAGNIDCNKNVFWLTARALPQAFFLPNLMLAFTITFMAGIVKSLKVME